MRLFASALVAGAMACSGCRASTREAEAVQEPSSSACLGEKPETWYGRAHARFHANRLEEARQEVQRVAASIRDHPNIVLGSVEASTDPRQLQVEDILGRYRTGDLRCWSFEGDQIASIAYARSPDSSVSDQDRAEALERASMGAEPFIPGVTHMPFPVGCNEQLARADAHCESGLPEAQFQLAMRSAVFAPDTCIEWLRRAYLGGLWPAQARFVECRGER